MVHGTADGYPLVLTVCHRVFSLLRSAPVKPEHRERGKQSAEKRRAVPKAAREQLNLSRPRTDPRPWTPEPELPDSLDMRVIMNSGPGTGVGSE